MSDRETSLADKVELAAITAEERVREQLGRYAVEDLNVRTELKQLDRDGLRAEWLRVTGEPAPAKWSTEDVRRKLEKRIEELRGWLNPKAATEADGVPGESVMVGKGEQCAEPGCSADLTCADTERCEQHTERVDALRPVIGVDMSAKERRAADVVPMIKQGDVSKPVPIPDLDLLELGLGAVPLRTTREELARLHIGQKLEHRFADGSRLRVVVLCPPDKEGRGARYRVDARRTEPRYRVAGVFDSLNTLIRQATGTVYNPLYFFGLRAWPKHRNRVTQQEIREAAGAALDALGERLKNPRRKFGRRGDDHVTLETDDEYRARMLG